MIISADVVPLLLAAAPSYRKRFQAYFDAHYVPGNMHFLYMDLGDFAAHMVELTAAGNIAEVPAVFAAIERLHTEGDSFVREAATMGFLGPLHTIAARHEVDINFYASHMGPETLRWWGGLELYWAGKIPFVRPVD